MFTRYKRASIALGVVVFALFALMCVPTLAGATTIDVTGPSPALDHEPVTITTTADAYPAGSTIVSSVGPNFDFDTAASSLTVTVNGTELTATEAAPNTYTFSNGTYGFTLTYVFDLY